jgi:D-serine deaminase-like pyridoxal phosphate-dependent protein
VSVPPDCALAVGDVVRLGISHPCTAFQLWGLVPEVDGDRVVGFVETMF